MQPLKRRRIYWGGQLERFARFISEEPASAFISGALRLKDRVSQNRQAPRVHLEFGTETAHVCVDVHLNGSMVAIFEGLGQSAGSEVEAYHLRRARVVVTLGIGFQAHATPGVGIKLVKRRSIDLDRVGRDARVGKRVVALTCAAV
jgi:hypothetical protein